MDSLPPSLLSYPQAVRVFVSTQDPDYDCPWQSSRTSNSTGSAVLINSREILTGAHVIANATFIQVQKHGHPEKTVAQVKAVCHDCDLALLKVNDPHFFEGIAPAILGDIPQLRDKVAVVGFPIGGEEISITEGVVSRIEVQSYSHSQRNLLAVTVDAAINKGNSGGPVFKAGKVAGIAFQKMDDAENIGEMVPSTLIHHFLEGVSQKKSLEIPSLSISTQKLENPLLRQTLGLPKKLSGILVNAVSYGGSAWGKLKPRDVLLEIEGAPIANNGTVLYHQSYRTRYDVVLAHYYVGDSLKLKILRQGKIKEITLKLLPLKRLVPVSQYDIFPSYFIYGGFVFQPLTFNFINTWEEWWQKAPPELLQYFYRGTRTKGQEEVILLNQVLADEMNVGYERLNNGIIYKMNGRTPRNMKEFVQKIENSKTVIELETSNHSLIVLDPKAVQFANERILKRYQIRHDRSPDLA